MKTSGFTVMDALKNERDLIRNERNTRQIRRSFNGGDLSQKEFEYLDALLFEERASLYETYGLIAKQLGKPEQGH